MNIATTRGQGKTMSLPNILTYARIAAIPVVVGCIESIAERARRRALMACSCARRCSK